MKFDKIDMQALEKELTDIRRDLHKYPESAWTEFRTTAIIIDYLEKLGIKNIKYGKEIHTPEKMFGLPKPSVMEECYNRALKESTRPELIEKMKGGFTGCIAEIEGEKSGPTIGIRVDIDCNDVDEATDEKHLPAKLGFNSVHKNCMHACGHDSHACIGLGTAKILMAYREELCGKVILVFQPGEEGLRGAASLTATGAFDHCDYFFGAHVGIKDLPVGTIVASAYGLLSSTKFDVSFHGKSAHAGVCPNLGNNAIAAGATATLNMLAIARHQAGSSRINIGTFNGGTGRNVIPSEAVLAVETRGGSPEINEYMEGEAKRICKAAADMYNCTCDFTFMGGAGGVTCDKPLVDKAMNILKDVEGVTNVIETIDFGGGEDVSTMMRAAQNNGGQVTQMLIGMPLVAPHHNNFFDIDEKVIGIGARTFASLALEVTK